MRKNIKRIIRYFSYFLLIICAALLANFIHESGHAIFVLISGGIIIKFIPFPVFIGGEWVAGYVEYKNVPVGLEPLVMLGGEIFQWISIAIIISLLYNFPKIRIHRFLKYWVVITWLDYPLYVINNSIGLPHWFLIGSTSVI